MRLKAVVTDYIEPDLDWERKALAAKGIELAAYQLKFRPAVLQEPQLNSRHAPPGVHAAVHIRGQTTGTGSSIARRGWSPVFQDAA
ncbi:MAG: hypothetical protein K9N49_02625 [Candidatus Marinimicrobia bacterium]|nr:hypothetical protein [Candidatus Neomarinimicrobiota bacterium]